MNRSSAIKVYCNTTILRGDERLLSWRHSLVFARLREKSTFDKGVLYSIQHEGEVWFDSSKCGRSLEWVAIVGMEIYCTVNQIAARVTLGLI
jgi:hypothetical protein